MRIAVVGAGYWGANLIRVFSQLGVLDQICDFSPAALVRWKTQYPDVKMEGSLDAMLDNPAVDAVVIATPAECHYEMARKSLLAGKDTYVEKPLTLRCEEVEKLTILAERLGRILMVGHVLEFHPAITRLQELIEQGELGYEKKIDLVNGQFVVEKPVARAIDFPPDEPLRLECEHFLEC